MKKIFLFLTLFLIPAASAQQDINITEYLVQIEQGNAGDVKNILPQLKKENSGAPSLLYLEGLLTEDGTSASKIYTSLIDRYPKSTYADAALYRLYSYYSALGQHEQSKKYYDRLLKEFPYSPYLKIIPGVKENTVTPEKYKYTIQAGAFSNNTNAENLRKKFVKAGYYTTVKDKNVGGSIFKIVYTGRFKTRTEAESFQVILNKEYGLEGIITQYQE